MAFIAIELPTDLSSSLAKIKVPGKKEDPATLHITLFYLGDNYPVVSLLQALKSTLQLTNKTKSFSASIEQVSHFPSDDDIPIILPIISEELHQFRNKLAKSFDKNKVPYSKKFKEYRPHITLSYAKKPIEDFKIKKEKFAIDKITLFGGDNYDNKVNIEFSLQKDAIILTSLFHKLAISP